MVFSTPLVALNCFTMQSCRKSKGLCCNKRPATSLRQQLLEQKKFFFLLSGKISVATHFLHAPTIFALSAGLHMPIGSQSMRYMSSNQSWAAPLCRVGPKFYISCKPRLLFKIRQSATRLAKIRAFGVATHRTDWFYTSFSNFK